MTFLIQDNNGGRICQNPICPEKKDLKSRNPRKRFCCTRCKNQAAYLFKQKNYAWENEMGKGRNRNIQILEYLYGIKTVFVELNQLQKMGFNELASYLPITNNEDKNIFRYGNLGLEQIGTSLYKIIKIN